MVGDRDREEGEGCVRVQIAHVISYSQYLGVLSIFLFLFCLQRYQNVSIAELVIKTLRSS